MPNETMNTEYHTIDGATFSAADATDLMTKLRQDSFNPEADLPSYCRATARASKMQTGKPHRPWPPKARTRSSAWSTWSVSATTVI